LTGSIPDLSGLTNLTRIILEFNFLTGPLPKFPIAVYWIALKFNDLTGTIPDSIGDYPSLGKLYLQNNGLSGKIPATIANLVSLNSLSLVNNNLTGLVPTSLNNLELLNFCELVGDSKAPYGKGQTGLENGGNTELCRDSSLTTCNAEEIPGTILFFI
jgi:Leucine-rich repeat (LRR) protein